MDFEAYETACESIQTANEELLKLFEEDLVKSGLTDKTINRHLSNVDFYINTYLLRAGVLPMEEGTKMLDDFLGNFFIRKCMWSTPSNIKSTAASIKKFYKCMLDHKRIEKNDYDFLCDEIRDSMDFWQESCAIYNDPEAPSPFFPF